MNEINGAGRKRLAITAATAAVAMLALLSVASPVAFAAPKGIFTRFAQCPTSVPGVTLCQYAEITSGELVIGPLQIPIGKTVVLQGGGVSTGKLNEYFVLPPTNGEAISPTKLEVPGGLRAILGCPDPHGPNHRSWWSPCPGRIHAEDWNEVTAKLEPAASTTNPARIDLIAVLFEEETGVTLPIKIKLENPLLGETCHLGSEAHPIELRLTTGTTSPPPPNQPITGAHGNFTHEEEEGQELTVLTGNTLVDGAFSVPPAEGCGGHLAAIVDQRIDQALGLESPAGHNTAILIGTHSAAFASDVLASESFSTKEETTPPPPSHHHGHHHHHWWWSEH